MIVDEGSATIFRTLTKFEEYYLALYQVDGEQDGRSQDQSGRDGKEPQRAQDSCGVPMKMVGRGWNDLLQASQKA